MIKKKMEFKRPPEHKNEPLIKLVPGPLPKTARALSEYDDPATAELREHEVIVERGSIEDLRQKAIRRLRQESNQEGKKKTRFSEEDVLDKIVDVVRHELTWITASRKVFSYNSRSDSYSPAAHYLLKGWILGEISKKYPELEAAVGQQIAKHQR